MRETGATGVSDRHPPERLLPTEIISKNVSYLNECILKIDLQKSIPTQIRQLVLCISNGKG